ncbi:AAA family ATPase, partial [Streptococcus pyogenes]
LFVEGQDKRDFGHRVIETLLTYLSLEDTDMIVILAGYTNEMKQLLESNPGLKSRFPYIFHFEDYSPEQLMNIGKKV